MCWSGFAPACWRPAPSRYCERLDWASAWAETPLSRNVCYSYARRGFALASMRTPMLSRYYIQCDLDAKLQDWPDERFWEEFKARCPPDMAARIVTGPSIEKSIAPLRSF